MNHPIYQVIKTEPSILNEEKNETYLSYLESTLDHSSEKTNNELLNEHFILMRTFDKVSTEFKMKENKRSIKILVTDNCFSFYKEELQNILSKLQEGNYYYNYSKVFIYKPSTITQRRKLYLNYPNINYSRILLTIREKLHNILEEPTHWIDFTLEVIEDINESDTVIEPTDDNPNHSVIEGTTNSTFTDDRSFEINITDLNMTDAEFG